mmetsp:Transcript_2115/g.13769  ORF Transcript_2115/g.13769 Transcript_2115/m.13769 type:complete len:298 (+) Transcript_2115:63-956(+)
MLRGRAPRVSSKSQASVDLDLSCVRGKISKLHARLRPTQDALGWDWTFYKLQNFRSRSAAQEYMDKKPVPVIQRGKKYYVVDRHHTLSALKMSGWDPEITLQVVQQVDKDERSLDAFWGYLEGKGWAFMRDENYQRQNFDDMPKEIDLEHFRNDIYRSLGGFARTHNILQRGKTLDERLFFEFRWGYFFWLHRNNEFGLWPDERLHRGWLRMMNVVRDIDMTEYMLENVANTEHVNDLLFLSKEVIEPAYRVLCFHVKHLCYAYDELPEEAKDVPGMKDIFGVTHSKLPGKVIRPGQ